jgi:hypothetical protein
VKPWRTFVPALMALAAGAAGLVLVACSSSSPSPANEAANVENAIVSVCTATTPPTCDGGGVPRYADVTPILVKGCIPCHPGPPGATQWPLTDYSDIQPWASVILDEVCGSEMPPEDGGIAITEADRLTLLNWAQCGAPE